MNRLIIAALVTISFAGIAQAQTGHDALENGRIRYEANKVKRESDPAKNFRFDLTDSSLNSEEDTYHVSGAIRYEVKGEAKVCPFNVTIARGNFIDKTICKESKTYYFDLRIREKDGKDILFAEVLKNMGTLNPDLILTNIVYDLN
ncbi:MAG: hypothetical protein R2877_06845 [Bdellovibrionota bacterium]